MRFRFTIAKRLILGFGILSLAVIVNSVLIFTTLNKNRKQNEKINKVYTKSIYHLHDLIFLINDTKILIKNWVYEHQDNTPNKRKLRQIHQVSFPGLIQDLQPMVKQWDEKERNEYNQILSTITDTLFVQHKEVMQKLNKFEAYEDLGTLFQMEAKVEDGGEIIEATNHIVNDLVQLLDEQKKKANDASIIMEKSFDSFQRIVLILGIISVGLAIITAYFTTRSLVRPVKYLKQVLLSMGEGVLPDKLQVARSDEIGEMSTALNNLAKGLRKTSEFSLAIGKGNFDKAFTPMSENDDLGNSLLHMREDLKKAAEEEKRRKKEDEERNWVTRGLAMFSDILRVSIDNMEELSFQIIHNLVKYVEANQGGMFILNDDDENDPFLELVSVYAYDRKKYADKRVEIGEGLVGACYKEKNTIYLQKVPDSYVNITSGLGKANPRCVLIVPLKVNNEVFGVIELASFYHFSPIKVEFVEKIAESIASTIANVKVNIRTARLLSDSQTKGEQLAQQEEEMRQNMEEMQATQEESERIIRQGVGIIEAMDKVVMKCEMTLDGTIVDVNENFTNELDYKESELRGRNFKTLIPKQDILAFDKKWKRVCSGKPYEVVSDAKNGRNEFVPLIMAFTPVREDYEIKKILCICKSIPKGLTKTQEEAKATL